MIIQNKEKKCLLCDKSYEPGDMQKVLFVMVTKKGTFTQAHKFSGS